MTENKNIKVFTQLNGQSQLTVLTLQGGQPTPKFRVQSGQKITFEIDGHAQSLNQINSARHKLVRHGNDVHVLSADEKDEILVLEGYFNEPNAVLAGENWAWVDDVPLEQSAVSVSVDPTEAVAQVGEEAFESGSSLMAVPPLLSLLYTGGSLAVAYASVSSGGSPLLSP